ncbi:hypothetical protein [Pseudoxanthomonas broegbernensis]|uniref:hypothetical protein n=1 Tax=Pseudoxanthomonas broegbernensis TaxID=83619 RepID=UPI0031B6F72F
MPLRRLSSTSFLRATSSNRLSVGCTVAFSCVVVSTITRDSSRASTAFIDRAAAIVCASSSSMPASPSRCRQRVSELALHGSLVWNTTSPVKNCQYGFSSQRTHTSSSDRS